MQSNDEAIIRLHHIADRIREGHGENALILSEENALSCDLGASAIKTIDDMSEIFQKLITLDTDDIDNLTSFLKTHTLTEIVATLDYIKENNYNDKN